MKALLRVLAVTFISVFIVSGCEILDAINSGSEDDPVNTEAERLVNEAKLQLSLGAYEPAKALFWEVLQDVDPENDQAKFGWSVAATLGITQQVTSELLFLVVSLEELSSGFSKKQLVKNGKLTPAGLEAMQAFGLIASLISKVVGSFDNSLLIIEDYLSHIAEDRSFVFRIDRLPVYAETYMIMDIGGEYDRAEALLFAGIARFLRGVLEILFATSFEFNMGAVLPAFELIGSDEYSVSIGNISDLVAYLFGTSPQFMSLNGDGVEKMNNAGLYWGEAADYLSRAVDAAFEETDSQLDDIFAVDTGAEPPQIILNVDFSGNNAVGPEVLESGILFFDITYSLKEAADKLRDNLLSGGEPVVWSDAIAPVLSVILSLAFDTGFISAFASSFLRELNPELKDLIIDALYSSRIGPEAIANLTTKLIPDYILWDFGEFFRNPVGLRYIMPPVDVPEGAISDPRLAFDSNWIAEWECTHESLNGDLSVYNNVFCPGGDNAYLLTDIDHFPNPVSFAAISTTIRDAFLDRNGIVQIPADGVISPLPYLPVLDPTFNHLFWVDVTQIPQKSPADAAYTGPAPADLYSFNKALASMGLAIVDEFNGEDWVSFVIDLPPTPEEIANQESGDTENPAP